MGAKKEKKKKEEKKLSRSGEFGHSLENHGTAQPQRSQIPSSNGGRKTPVKA